MRAALFASAPTFSLGLKHGINYLVDYDPGWPVAFEEESARILAAVGDVARGIEHYGSTAVEGLKAKPILDILLGVLPLRSWIDCKLPLEGLGYDYAENAGVPGHFIFGRGRDRGERTHLVHVVEFKGDSWRTNLAFRDALRADQSLRAEYLQVKERAVTLAPAGRAQYGELKQSFFAGVERRLAQIHNA
jgi:GrpB-like predicted nucleotidyltransferase (UPF0157 family)